VRSRLLATATAACLATLALGSPAHANHSWNGYHWARTANPFTVKLGDNVSSTWDPYLRTASSDWTRSTVLDTVVVAGSTRPRTCKPTAGMVQVCNASYGNTGWLGIAGISVTGGVHITKGYVKLNDTYFNTATYNTPSWRQLVTCQEVGHTFGLDHQDTNFTNPNLGTCMDYTNNPDGPPSNLHPNTHDYDELVTIYTHLDSFSTVGATPAGAAAAAPGDTPASWGTQIAGSAHGVATYVRDRGHGQADITFVFWA
jgi:hypothetical protein